MRFKKFLLISFFVLALFPFCKINAESSNIGFVQSDIWYSPDPFEEGDKIKIYTLIFNPESRELSGTVMFLDDETVLGEKVIKIPSKSVKDVSIDWTVTAGKHSVYAKIENAKFLISAGKYETALLENKETDKDSFSVNKKITSATNDSNNSSEKDNQDNSNTVDASSIKDFIQEKTPAFVSKPIIATTDAMETFRINTNEKTDEKIEIVKQELEDLKKQEKDSDKTEAKSKTETETQSKLQKPWKYMQMLALQLGSLVFGNQFVFYTLIFILVFFLLRFIWLKIF
jgi:hypothetical protein